MKRFQLALLFLCLTVSFAGAEGKHLFILSGQSNMVGIDPDVSFTPAVEQAFGKNNVVVVKDAEGGQPIRRWVKNWEPAPGVPVKKGKGRPKPYGDLYDRLMEKVKKETKGMKFDTVTFIWMQGETDAYERHDAVYMDSLMSLLDQVRKDVKRDDVHYVIGRLSSYKMFKTWKGVRQAQVVVADASSFGAWVDTDDLERENLHYTQEGYLELGTRFAEQAIALIRENHP